VRNKPNFRREDSTLTIGRTNGYDGMERVTWRRKQSQTEPMAGVGLVCWVSVRASIGGLCGALPHGSVCCVDRDRQRGQIVRNKANFRREDSMLTVAETNG
jgi:hypothetical protein